jgi:hypothetical protein
MYQLLDHRPSLGLPDRASRPPAVTPVDSDLLAYLATRLGLRSARFAEPPDLVPDGWEAYVYRFRLSVSGALPPDLAGPLVLRLYAGPRGLPRARREFAAQTYACRHGYPAPKPLLLEADSRYLGGPFLVMEGVPGETLLNWLRGNWTRVLSAAARLAQAHVRLHGLPTAGLGSCGNSFLERQLDEVRRTIRTYDLAGLAGAFGWLDANRPPETSAPCMLHLDFHPVNLMVRDDDCVVTDWSEADLGDRTPIWRQRCSCCGARRSATSGWPSGKSRRSRAGSWPGATGSCTAAASRSTAAGSTTIWLGRACAGWRRTACGSAPARAATGRSLRPWARSRRATSANSVHSLPG